MRFYILMLHIWFVFLIELFLLAWWLECGGSLRSSWSPHILRIWQLFWLSNAWTRPSRVRRTWPSRRRSSTAHCMAAVLPHSFGWEMFHQKILNSYNYRSLLGLELLHVPAYVVVHGVCTAVRVYLQQSGGRGESREEQRCVWIERFILGNTV